MHFLDAKEFKQIFDTLGVSMAEIEDKRGISRPTIRAMLSPSKSRTVKILSKEKVYAALLEIHDGKRVAAERLGECLAEAPLFPDDGPVYICGPMTSIKDFNYPLFNETTARWRAAGWEVENPAETKAPEGATWEWFLVRAFERLLKCKAIATLPGWSKSKGAQCEVAVSRKLGMKRFRALDV